MPLATSTSAKTGILPKSFMMEKYGSSEPFYCDLEDPIEQVACMAWDAALGIANIYPGSQQVNLFCLFIGIEVAQIIQKILSSARSSLYVTQLKATGFPSMADMKLCLMHKHGICGNHQVIFVSVMRHFDIPARYVSFYYQKNGAKYSHGAVEICVDKKWRFVDISWSSVWLDNPNDIMTMLSIDEILLGNGSRQTNELDSWFWQVKNVAEYDPFEYLKLPLSGLVKGNTGRIKVELSDEYPLEKIPNYVGSNVESENGITHEWVSSKHAIGSRLTLDLNVKGFGGYSVNGFVLLDNAGNEYPLEEGSNQITITNGKTFNVKRRMDEICYIVFDKIKIIE